MTIWDAHRAMNTTIEGSSMQLALCPPAHMQQLHSIPMEYYSADCAVIIWRICTAATVDNGAYHIDRHQAGKAGVLLPFC